jgi:hypothetical protein
LRILGTVVTMPIAVEQDEILHVLRTAANPVMPSSLGGAA